MPTSVHKGPIFVPTVHIGNPKMTTIITEFGWNSECFHFCIVEFLFWKLKGFSWKVLFHWKKNNITSRFSLVIKTFVSIKSWHRSCSRSGIRMLNTLNYVLPWHSILEVLTKITTHVECCIGILFTTSISQIFRITSKWRRKIRRLLNRRYLKTDPMSLCSFLHC